MTHSVQAIFDQICDVEGDHRQAELLRLCGSNNKLRAEVESLLKAHDAAGDFLKEPTLNPPELAATVIYSTNGELLGSVIGTYKLLEQIGEGGFGIVYMAQQSVPIQRRLALKILKPGMDTKQVVARFESALGANMSETTLKFLFKLEGLENFDVRSWKKRAKNIFGGFGESDPPSFYACFQGADSCRS